MKTVLGVTMDKDVAGYFDGTPSRISAWKGRGKVPFDECVALAEKFGVSLDWLVFGRGPMEAPGKAPREAPAAAPVSAVAVSDRPCLVSLRAYNMDPWEELDVDDWWSVPLEWLQLECLDVHETIMVRAWGDTMRGTIDHGDMVLVDKRPREADGIYLIECGGVLRFKRLQHMLDGSVRVSCDDPVYAAESIENRSMLMVMGYCHAIVKRLK
jgi:hypothetical protein